MFDDLLARGAVDFLPKPFEVTDLLDRVQAQLVQPWAPQDSQHAQMNHGSVHHMHGFRNTSHRSFPPNQAQ